MRTSTTLIGVNLKQKTDGVVLLHLTLVAAYTSLRATSERGLCWFISELCPYSFVLIVCIVSAHIHTYIHTDCVFYKISYLLLLYTLEYFSLSPHPANSLRSIHSLRLCLTTSSSTTASFWHDVLLLFQTCIASEARQSSTIGRKQAPRAQTAASCTCHTQRERKTYHITLA